MDLDPLQNVLLQLKGGGDSIETPSPQFSVIHMYTVLWALMVDAHLLNNSIHVISSLISRPLCVFQCCMLKKLGGPGSVRVYSSSIVLQCNDSFQCASSYKPSTLRRENQHCKIGERPGYEAKVMVNTTKKAPQLRAKHCACTCVQHYVLTAHFHIHIFKIYM